MNGIRRSVRVVQLTTHQSLSVGKAFTKDDDCDVLLLSSSGVGVGREGQNYTFLYRRSFELLHKIALIIVIRYLEFPIFAVPRMVCCIQRCIPN
jgi:hypothetical protein